MTKKLTGRALAKFESERDIWQEVLAGVKEIKASAGKKSPFPEHMRKPLRTKTNRSIQS